MSTWPATLPQRPLVAGYSEQRADAKIRSSMSTGPAKVRRRFTAVPTTFSVEYLLTATQLATLETFYQDTLSEGAAPLSIPHPRTGASVSARFVEAYSISALGADKYRVSFDLEVLP